MLKKTDISRIPMEELMDDMVESLEDTRVCAEAIKLGIKEYSDTQESVISRFLGNLRRQAVITGEISRRLNVFIEQLESVEPEDRDEYITEVLMTGDSNMHVQLVLIEVE